MLLQTNIATQMNLLSNWFGTTDSLKLLTFAVSEYFCHDILRPLLDDVLDSVLDFMPCISGLLVCSSEIAFQQSQVNQWTFCEKLSGGANYYLHRDQ